MIWVKDQDKLDSWEVELIEVAAEACYDERARQISSKENKS
jgi:hypothetical protein